MAPSTTALTPRRSTVVPGDTAGFALVVVLVLLAALYLGATGIFLAARAELRVGSTHAASSQAFHLAEAGMTTWLASAVQPSTVEYAIGGETVVVEAATLLRVDSVTVAYRIVAHAEVGGASPADPGSATRQTSVVGVRTDGGPVRAVPGTWREVL